MCSFSILLWCRETKRACWLQHTSYFTRMTSLFSHLKKKQSSQKETTLWGRMIDYWTLYLANSCSLQSSLWETVISYSYYYSCRCSGNQYCYLSEYIKWKSPQVITASKPSFYFLNSLWLFLWNDMITSCWISACFFPKQEVETCGPDAAEPRFEETSDIEWICWCEMPENVLVSF